jgi:hypothetical protein
MEAKKLYRSNDDGRKWLLVAETPCFAIGCKNTPGVGILSIVGNGVASFGMVDALHRWLVLCRGGFSRTTDGGRTWQMPAWSPPSAFDDGRYGPALLVNARHGWVVVETDVARTIDGVHWQPILLTPSSNMPEILAAVDTATPEPMRAGTSATPMTGSQLSAPYGTPTGSATPTESGGTPFSSPPLADATLTLLILCDTLC